MSKRSFIRMGKKVLASAVSAAMVVAFTPVVAMAEGSAGDPDNTVQLVLPENIYESSFPEGKVVFFSNNYYASLNEAIQAANTAGSDTPAKIFCKPNADLGAATHMHCCTSIEVYGNGAFLSSGEMDIEVGMYDHDNNRASNHLSKDITIYARDLGNLGVWGNNSSGHSVDITLVNCDTKTGTSSMQRVYITGTSGDNTLSMVGCDIASSTSCTVKLDRASAVTISKCSFKGISEPINMKIDAGNSTITVSDTAFMGCGLGTENDKGWAAPIRVVNASGSNADVSLAVNNCTFTYASTKSQNGDILIGEGRTGRSADYPITATITSTAAEVQVQHLNYYSDNATGDVGDASKCATYAVEASEASTTILTHPVAIDATAYPSPQDAVNAAANGDVITLHGNSIGDIAIPKDKRITLDLNGHKLTNASGHTITNNGTLTIIDSSSTKTGTVDNVSHGKGALCNNAGATATLNGGTFTRSQENGQSTENNGGNSWYTLKNFGTMTINKGVVVNQGADGNGKYSSLVANGWQDGSTAGDVGNGAVMTINGGTFNGGLNTIKNDDYGILTINDGTFKNVAQHAVMNWNVASIVGGTFTSDTTTIYNGGGNSTFDQGKLTITGGSINGGSSNYLVYQGDYTPSELTIAGGDYVHKYITNKSIASGYEAHQTSDGRYHVHKENAGTKVTGATSATCTAAGFTGNTVCADCGMIITAGSTIPALGHAYGAYVTTVAPTETSTGVATSTCSRCGATQTTTLAKLEPAGSDTTATASDGSKVDVVINTNPSGTGSSAVNGTVTYNGPAEGSTATSVSIPATVTIGGSTYDVTTIAEDAFAGNSTVTIVTIPSTVTTIGEGAFENCTALTSVTVPAGVTAIAESTFAGCSSLATVEIKGSVTEINESAFEGCSALSSISVPDTVTKIGESAFEGCTSLAAITVPSGVTEIAPSTFAGCESLGTVELGSATTTIGVSAFEGCGKLTGIEIPSTVTEIGEKAFANSGLATVTLPAGVTTIAASAFAGCADLSYATLGAATAEIGDKAFENCTALKTIAIPASVKAIGASAFEGCSSLNSAAISGKTEVGPRAFANSGVTAVSIGKNVVLGKSAFEGCTKLATATVKAATLPSYAFKGCTALKSVSLAKGVKDIERSAFSGCKNLRNVVLPSSVEKIAKYAFYGASKAKTITVNSKKLTKSDVKNALKGSSVTTVKVPKSKVGDYKKLFTRSNCGKSVTVKGI